MNAIEVLKQPLLNVAEAHRVVTMEPQAATGAHRVVTMEPQAATGAHRVVTMEPQAATDAHRAITMEPQPQDTTKKYDKNGEEIIFEGECAHCSMYFYLCMIYSRDMAASVIGLILFIPIGILLCFAAAKTWKLYITRSGVHYCPGAICFCVINTYDIPLHDIKGVYLAQGNIVGLRVGPEKMEELFHWCNRPMCSEVDTFVLRHVANGQAFVEAVEREISNA